MNDSAWIWPASDMDFWKIDNKETSVKIKWSHNCFEDYKTLSYQFYKCGYKTFEEVIGSGYDNVKSDMWFLTGIFLVRHSIELGLKALLCRVLPRKRDIEDAFEACCHDVSMLFHKYTDVRLENYLTEEEEDWLIRYLDSLEEVDKKSDMFRFPFEDEFLSKYRDKFLDNVDVANNMLQGYALVKKCIERGIVTEEDEFDGKLKPEFFVFASHGIGNCYLWQRISDEGFHVKVAGYSEVIDYIYQNQNITNEDKLYPLIFMFRNTIELCLKRLFYSRVDNGVPLKVFNSKRKSHLIKKDLWKNVKPVIKKYANGESIVPPIFKSERAVYYGDVSSHLANLVVKKLGVKARSEKPGLCGRASVALQSPVDREEARQAGTVALRSAVEGNSGVMVGFERVPGTVYQMKTKLVPIKEVMLYERKMPDNFINERGNDVTQEFVDWCRPLIGDPLPEFLNFKDYL